MKDHKNQACSKLNQRQRKLIYAIGGGLLLLLATFYLVTPLVAKQVVQRKVKHLEQEQHITIDLEQLKIAHISPWGTCDVRAKRMAIADPKATETFLATQQLQAKVQIWKGFRRTLAIKNLSIQKLNLHLVRRDGYCNYNFLKSTGDKKKHERDYRKMVTRLLEKVGNYCPNALNIEQMSIRTDLDSTKVDYGFRDLRIRNGKVSGNVAVQQASELPVHWVLTGNLDNKKKQYEGTVICEGGSQVLGALPFLQHLNKFDVRLHEAHACFSLGKTGKKNTLCKLSGHVRHLQCQHHYLADEPVHIDSIGGNLNLAIGAKSIVIDSTSTIRLNRAELHPRIEYTHNKSKHIRFNINEKDRNAEPLFASLPEHLFQIIPNMKIEGAMDYHCLLDCDFGCLDSLKFDFGMVNRGRSIRIVEGLGEITRFNEQFEYTFYDHGEPVRNLWIGPNNPYFCPNHQIPELLKQAILASEDGAFFVHNGFCKSAMQQALIDDLKAGKMRRGGSTITMQLVKNLFLSRKKVLTRKFEEMLLVWMIEDQHLISKERLFEIYVNIIEWAPGVIGIGEASEFYFHKRPHELTMPECIYLASLIRAPKHYASTLNADGSITDIKRSELEFVADRMVTREFMTEAQRSVFDANVKTVIRRSEN